MTDRKGILTVVSGFSGAGKGTLMKELMKKYKDIYALSVSATTRKPRPGEVEGKEYFFTTKDEFEKMIAKGELIEYTEYVGNYYGTPRSYVEKQLAAGKDVILEIDTIGGFKVRKDFPGALLLFVTTPSAEELKRRLARRGTESYTAVASRLARAAKEAEVMDRYDYILVNDDLGKCTEEMHRIIQGEHCRCFRNTGLIRGIKKELDTI